MVMLEEAATWWLGRVIAFIALCVISGVRGKVIVFQHLLLSDSVT